MNIRSQVAAGQRCATIQSEKENRRENENADLLPPWIENGSLFELFENWFAKTRTSDWSDKTMNLLILTNCWTPEWYDAVSNAVIEFDSALVDCLVRRMEIAKRLQKEEPAFMSLEFGDEQPLFVDIGDAEDVGLTDEFLDTEVADGGWGFLPEAFDTAKLATTSMRPVILYVGPNDFYWHGFDKHGSAGCRAETYRMTDKDLQEISEKLGMEVAHG